MKSNSNKSGQLLKTFMSSNEKKYSGGAIAPGITIRKMEGNNRVTSKRDSFLRSGKPALKWVKWKRAPTLQGKYSHMKKSITRPKYLKRGMRIAKYCHMSSDLLLIVPSSSCHTSKKDLISEITLWIAKLKTSGPNGFPYWAPTWEIIRLSFKNIFNGRL